MNDLIAQRLNQYALKTKSDELNALKEITQEIILYALSTTQFFKKTHFCGGTALRILHGLGRFSEDLDFSLNNPNDVFEFDDYIPQVLNTLQDYGLDMQLKKAKDNRLIKIRELKKDSDKWQLSFPDLDKVVIKLEIDTNPPVGALSEHKILDFPILHQVNVGSIETLFAGKINALLCRGFIKGRDWYDFLWYVKNKHPINYDLLEHSLTQMDAYKNQNIANLDGEWLKDELSNKIKSIDWKKARDDVRRFVKPNEIDSLELWSVDLFLDRLKQLSKLAKMNL